PGSQVAEKSTTELVGGKEAVHVAATHSPVSRDRAVRAVGEPEPRPPAVSPFRLPHMHLVAGDRSAGRHLGAGDTRKNLLRREPRLDVEKAEPGDSLGRSLDSFRVVDYPAEYLIAATDADNVAAAAQMRAQVHVPTRASQKAQIGDRGLRSRKNDEVGVSG